MTLTILLPWLVLGQLLACGTPHFGVNVFGLEIVTGGYLFGALVPMAVSALSARARRPILQAE